MMVSSRHEERWRSHGFEVAEDTSNWRRTSRARRGMMSSCARARRTARQFEGQGQRCRRRRRGRDRIGAKKRCSRNMERRRRRLDSKMSGQIDDDD
ncbi:hypothetical protein M0R45_025319 [Rubus argutus]|uniref:Uncharacterized protein n=1 Tax=Rubus argutus TaxID=59490 RepID=A0AAW1WVC6_RUBAR